MKKIITILFAAGMFCFIGQTTSAQSLKNLFSKDKLKNVVENVTGLDLDKENATIKGTWKFSGTAVNFKTDDILKKAAAKIAVEAVENKLDEVVQKIGITPGLFSFTFTANNTFTITFKKKNIEGTYALSSDKKKLTLTFGRFTKLGTMDIDVDLGSKEMELLFKAKNLIELLDKIASSGSNDALKALSILVEAYDNIYLGLELQR